MRVLFLALSFPLPANNGHKMRTWALLRALAIEGHQVSLLAFARQDEALPAERSLPSVCRDVGLVPLTLTSLTHNRDVLGRLTRMFSPLPYGVTRFDSPAMREEIRVRLQREQFDAIVCDVYTIVNIPPLAIPIVFNGENVEHLLLRRFVAREANPAKRGYAALEARKMERWERGAWERSGVVLACSEVDRGLVRRLAPATPSVLAPNVVDVDTYTPGRTEAGRVLFQGGMDYFPNVDGVAYFASEILPRLRRLIPGVTFVAAGRNPSLALLRRFAHEPDVELTGTVPDMRAELARAAACVVPLRIGSGTRLKILEAAAMAQPIVSTSIGAEGLDFTDGRDILIADGPDAFAHALASVLRDPEARVSLGREARRTVETRYAFANLVAGVRGALSVVASPARAQTATVNRVEWGYSA